MRPAGRPRPLRRPRHPRASATRCCGSAPRLTASTRPTGRWADERLAALRAARRHAPSSAWSTTAAARATPACVDPASPRSWPPTPAPSRRATPGSSTTRRSTSRCTTARFAGLYGSGIRTAATTAPSSRALLNQCRAVVLAMRAIRRVNPHARLVQTDDLGKTYSTPELAHQAEFYNERRWLAWDLLCGTVDRGHPLWDYLLDTGIAEPTNRCGSATTPARPTSSASTTTSPASAGSTTGSSAIRPHRRGMADGRPATPTSRPSRVAGHADGRHRPAAARGLGPLPHAAGRDRGPHRRQPRGPAALAAGDLGSRQEVRARRRRRARGDGLVAARLVRLEQPASPQSRGYYEPGPFDVRAPEPRPTALARA